MPISRFSTFSLFFFLVGIWQASVHSNAPTTFSVIFLVVCLLITGIAGRFKTYWLVFLWLIINSWTGGWLFTAWWRQNQRVTYTTETTQSFQAVISEPPDIRQDSIYLTVSPLRPLAYRNTTLVRSNLLIRAKPYPRWRYGDLISVKGTIEKPTSFNGFNYPLYLERFHIYGTMSRPKKLRLVAHNHGNPFLMALYSLAGYQEKIIQKAIPEPESSFLSGILLGSKRSIPQFIQDALKQNGISHIIAISGANITIVLTIIASLIPIWKKQHQFLVILATSIFITILTGASASVVRFAVVACFNSDIQCLSRRAWPTPFILLSMTWMLLTNSFLLVADPGFQLSFAAFTELAYLGKPIKNAVNKFKWSQRLPEAIKSAFSETTAATTATAFLSSQQFGQISLLGLLVNPLVLWLLPVTTALGLILICFSWPPGLVTIIRIPLWFLLHAILSIIQSFGNISFGVIKYPI